MKRGANASDETASGYSISETATVVNENSLSAARVSVLLPLTKQQRAAS